MFAVNLARLWWTWSPNAVAGCEQVGFPFVMLQHTWPPFTETFYRRAFLADLAIAVAVSYIAARTLGGSGGRG
ncbi:MAG: hypothetical protein HKN47_28995 [Pirellulaceae bacterium]|nr:hypothetical protein [Pirellulaceae bacterium]